ncbi:MAG: hypothetical protein Q8R78_04280 [Candidatus Omnitrophota bacterium]|nr:hypothetical protein [Candidatus Omnitrophota bacterium]
MKPPLSPQQAKVYAFIAETIAQHGYSPSLAAMQEYLGVKSHSSAYNHVKALIAKGYLTREKYAHRGLRIVSESGVCPTCGQPLQPEATP